MIRNSTLRRGLRFLAISLSTAALGLVVLWGVSMKQSHGINLGRFSISASRGNLEVSFANAPLKRLPDGWTFPEIGARILLENGSRWRPTMQTASMTIGPAPTPTLVLLRVIFIPVWLAIVPLMLSAIISFTWSRRILKPGHCTACGYDRKGIKANACPECGNTALLALQMLVARITRATVSSV